MKTTTLIGLMALGFLMLFIGLPWWLGIGVILLSMTLGVTGYNEVQPVMQPMPVPPLAQAAPEPEPFKQRGVPKGDTAKGEPFTDVLDMKWSPSVFADGIFGIAGMGAKRDEHGCSIAPGSRTGALGMDMGPIRFKDDMRFRMDVADDSPGGMKDMLRTPSGPISAWDFRTRKPALIEPTKQFSPIIKSPDDWADPGLGSPREWEKRDSEARKAREDARRAWEMGQR